MHAVILVKNTSPTTAAIIRPAPHCGRQATANWLQRELNKLVEAPYFMVNFTLPAQLRSFFLGPHAPKAFGTGTHAVKYLGAYVSRTAIGDSRILEINDETVRFSWKDRSDGDKLKQLTLPGTDFVLRYLRHVLPKGLRSIRYFGF